MTDDHIGRASSEAPDPAPDESGAAGAAGAAGAPAPSAPGSVRSRRRTLYAVGGAVGVAILGATASALITPERIDQILGSVGGAQPTPSASAVAVEYKTVTNADRAITVDIPDEWGAGLARWNATPDPGSALRTGFDTGDLVSHEADGGYLGVSAGPAVAVAAETMSTDARREWLRTYIDVDWTPESCVLEPEPVWEKAGWLVEATRWKDCASFQGHRFFEFAATNDAGTMLVLAQVTLTEATPDEVMLRFVDSFAINTGNLPGDRTGDLITP